MRKTLMHRHRGSAYILILGVSMLAATICVAATLAGRAQARAISSSSDSRDARSFAQSAIDLGRLVIAQDSTWRTDHSNGTWFSGMAIGTGSMQLDVRNPAGALNRFNADPIILTGTGSCGTSVQKIQVALTPQIKPYTCLSTAAIAGNNIQFQSAKVNPPGALITSNGTIALNSASITCNLEAVGTINLGSAQCVGSIASGAASRTMPGSNVFDYYTANGTTLSISSLPQKDGNPSLTGGVLAPGVNTIAGSANANGIYVINCQGNDFTIFDVRICGTLVLLNCGQLTIQGSTNWTPAVSTFPALLLQGGLTINVSASPLSELSSLNNYNPAGAPYPWPNGIANILPTETYPSTLSGLMYATGSATLSSDANIGMLVSGGIIKFSSKTANFTYNPDYIANPPPGFYDVDMTPSSMTYQQATN